MVRRGTTGAWTYAPLQDPPPPPPPPPRPHLASRPPAHSERTRGDVTSATSAGSLSGARIEKERARLAPPGEGGPGKGGLTPVFCPRLGGGRPPTPPPVLPPQLQQSGGTEVREGVYISSEETAEIEGSRGEAHLVMKFPGGTKQCSMSVVAPRGKTRAVTEDDADFVPMVAFECRGMEPVKWSPKDGLCCRSTGGRKYTDVDLSEGEWFEYDDENDLSVSIQNIEHEFRVIKV